VSLFLSGIDQNDVNDFLVDYLDFID